MNDIKTGNGFNIGLVIGLFGGLLLNSIILMPLGISLGLLADYLKKRRKNCKSEQCSPTDYLQNRDIGESPHDF